MSSIVDTINCKDPKKVLLDFISFSKKELELQTLPVIKLTNSYIKSGEYNSFAVYNLNEKSVTVYIKNRHILDILRSLAHELVHYRQDLSDELTETSGKTGSLQENEANAVAGQIMRNYGKLHPELF